MGSEWEATVLGEKIAINPERKLKRGQESVYVSMQALDSGNRSVSSFGRREFNGSGSRFQNGDTLLARITPCLENGKTAYVDFLEEGELAHGSTEFIILSAVEGVSDNLFVYYLARSPEFRAYAIAQMEGSSGRQRVPAPTLKRFLLDFPSLPEQQAIAHILGSLDDKIELNRHMNETLEAMAQAIFKSWFVDFDPVRTKAEGRDPLSACGHAQAGGLPKEIADLFPDSFEDLELGEIPKGWKIQPISSLLHINPRLKLSKGDVAKYVDMKSLPTSGFSVSAVIEKPFKGGSKFQQDDVLLARITPCLENGKTALVDFLCKNEVAFGSTEFIVLRGKNGVTSQYVYCLARNIAFREHCISSMVGSSGRQRVQNACFDHFKQPVPRENILQVFAGQTEPVFKNITANSQQIQTLSNLRDTLLPKLISGELRVPDCEKLMGDMA